MHPRLSCQHAATLALTLGLLPATTHAQDNQRQIERILRAVEGGQPFSPRVDTSLSLWERAQFDYGGSIAYSYLNLNQSGGNSARLLSPEATLYARLNIDGAHSFYARTRFVHRDYSEGDSFDGRGDRWIQPFADRYWYEFDLRRAMDAYQGESIQSNFNIRVGRQFLEWGSGLALSEALYAAKATIEFDRRTRLDALVGITPDHTPDFDSSRFNYDFKTRRLYYGALLSHTFAKGDEAYAYALRMDDRSNEDRSRIGGLFDIDFNRDSTYLGLGARGTLSERWLYQAEAVLQIGDSASDPLLAPQTTEDLAAWAGRFQVTYVLADENDTRLQAELLIFSGDKDRRSATDTIGGNATGTDDNGFSSLGFAFTGVAFSAPLSNLVSLRAGAATFPARSSETFGELQVGADAILSFKYNRDGGIDEPTNNDAFLGTEFDVYANWRITSDLAVTGRYGVFFPGPAIQEPDDPRHFVYLGVTLAF